MVNLVRDNKVLTRKIFHNLKNWLTYTRVSIYGSCSPCFMANFCKINSVYRMYSYVYFKHIPDDSFVVIDDIKNGRVLIGIDFNTLLTRDNIVIEKGSGLTIQKNVYNMATTYLKSVSIVLRDKGKGKSTLCYVDLVKELRDVFGGELSDRDNILLIANINYKKGTVTLPRMSYVSTGWNILKGAKRNSYDINAVTEVLRSGKGSPRELDVVTSIHSPSEYKDNTLYILLVSSCGVLVD